MSYLPGQRVMFTTANLGLIGRPETVGTRDTGTVLGPGPDEPWVYVEPDAYPGAVCPVYPSMIVAAKGGE